MCHKMGVSLSNMLTKVKCCWLAHIRETRGVCGSDSWIAEPLYFVVSKTSKFLTDATYILLGLFDNYSKSVGSI